MRKHGFLVMTLAAVLVGLQASAAEVVRDTSTYPLGVCPVSGQALGEPHIKTIEGDEVRFCCPGCESAYTGKLEAYTKKVDGMIVEAQKPGYPLDTCVVSGEELGSMGEPVEYVHEYRLVRLCCGGCKSGFEKDPGKYLDKLDAAVVEKQGADYPLDSCAVAGNPLGDTAVDFIIGGKLVRLCCPGCVDKVKADPIKYFAKIEGKEAPASDEGSAAKEGSGSK